MNNINLDLSKSTYSHSKEEKQPTHDIRFTISFDDELQAIVFFTKLVQFVEQSKKEITNA